jgi:hypothetical protein
MPHLWRRLPSTLPAAVAAFFLCAVVPAAAQTTPTNEDCQLCHAEPTLTREDGTSVTVLDSVYEASVHGQLGMNCVDCHSDLADSDEFPHPERLARVDCSFCHADASSDYERGVHSQMLQAGQSRAATCADCHGSHEIRPSGDPESLTNHLRLPLTCGRCHGADPALRPGEIAMADVLSLFQDSIHGRALDRSGLTVAPHCGSCHGHHDILRAADPESRVHHATVPATCGECHAGVERIYREDVHGVAVEGSNPFAPSCSDCHTAHEIRRIDVPAWRLDVIRECGTCHEESIRTYRDTFHGQVTALGFLRVATCSSCHGAHGIYPKTNPRSLVSDERIVSTCQECHPRANVRFARYDPHADRQNRERNPALYYTARFMHMLMLGVFAFFGIHTALWFSRTAGWRNRPTQRGPGRATADDLIEERPYEDPAPQGDTEPRREPRADAGGDTRNPGAASDLDGRQPEDNGGRRDDD